MSYRNVPDDWNQYWTVCSRCGASYHASEWCEVCEDMSEEEVHEMIEARGDHEIDRYELNKLYDEV